MHQRMNISLNRPNKSHYDQSFPPQDFSIKLTFTEHSQISNHHKLLLPSPKSFLWHKYENYIGCIQNVTVNILPCAISERVGHPTYNTSIQSHSTGVFMVPWRHAIAATLLSEWQHILEYSHRTIIGPDCLSIQVRDEGSAINLSMHNMTPLVVKAGSELQRSRT